MDEIEIDAAYIEVLAWLRPQVRIWRKFTIAIDGVDGSGKSPLARFLAWQLQMPAVETDLALDVGSGSIQHNNDLIRALINSRHLLDRPVIVEGIFILRTLAHIGVVPDVLIRVEAERREGSISWEQEFLDYRKSFARSSRPDYVLNWSPDR